MQSWILAVVLILVASPSLAAGNAQGAPSNGRLVPPIPAPSEAAPALAPLDRPWPASPAEGSLALEPRDVPPIPAPSLGMSNPARPTALNVPPIPGPGQAMVPVAPLDRPWPAAPAEAGLTPRDVPPIPGLALAPAVAPAPVPARVAPRPAFDPNGTVHVVAKGDTLWDISNLYLGTPWIWPSVWKDNEDIENPHLILPGDKIWVSATEMRKISDEEAAALLAGRGEAPAAMAEDMPAVPMPEVPRETFYYVKNSSLGLVSEKELKGLARVVGTTEEQIFLAQGDTVFVDLGENEVSVGDEFTLFRTSQKVYDPANHRSLGYHSEVVGWLEIVKIHGETARARIRQSYVDFVPGVYLKPRLENTVEIPILDSPPGVEGQIADLLLDPKYRGNGDVVILNRGSEDGVVAGSTLEVYRPVESNWKKTWYGRRPRVDIPHEVVADLVVLSAQPGTAMAYVTRSNTELWHGDRFRTVAGPSLRHAGRGHLTVEERVVRWVIAQGERALDEADRLRSQMSLPEAPDQMAGWNLPRLVLPNLDGYEPR